MNKEGKKVSEGRTKKAEKWRKSKKKTTHSVDDEWEAIRRDAWLRELLSRSSEDEGQAEEKKTRMEEKYKRF